MPTLLLCSDSRMTVWQVRDTHRLVPWLQPHRNALKISAKEFSSLICSYICFYCLVWQHGGLRTKNMAHNVKMAGKLIGTSQTPLINTFLEAGSPESEAILDCERHPLHYWWETQFFLLTQVYMSRSPKSIFESLSQSPRLCWNPYAHTSSNHS